MGDIAFSASGLTVPYHALIGIVVGIPALCTILLKWLDRLMQGCDWIKHQEAQDQRIDDLKERMDAQFSRLLEDVEINTNATLACLQGLHEQGCNGDVTAAIKNIQSHISRRAYERSNGGNNL